MSWCLAPARGSSDVEAIVKSASRPTYSFVDSEASDCSRLLRAEFDLTQQHEGPSEIFKGASAVGPLCGCHENDTENLEVMGAEGRLYVHTSFYR